MIWVSQSEFHDRLRDLSDQISWLIKSQRYIRLQLDRIEDNMADESLVLAALKASADAAVADLASMRAALVKAVADLAAAIAAQGTDNTPAIQAVVDELNAAVAMDAPAPTPAPVAPPSA